MPETTFTAELPDGSFQPCYSPSSVVRNYFTPGQEIPAEEFIRLSRAALTEASERVRQKFGFSCTAASASLADIERWAGALPPDTPLVITHIH
ncbi:MAG: MSMEG_0570 family nitrogen starvation response protein [Verrucomicrobiaceae bacterium]|nr:MAG: MSMEG_0570 family nitrogen starvation response protein [Verrucomicrobiaceae bacterium]